MAISEETLTQWSGLGAKVTSASTYETIRNALNAGTYGGKYSIWLQGSYGNDTNIWAESDVDVVMELTSVYNFDDSRLTPVERAVHTAIPSSTYNLPDFRLEVVQALEASFGNVVTVGSKAVSVAPLHNRRKTDILVCSVHRILLHYPIGGNLDAITGVSFWKDGVQKVVNYPEMHSAQLTAKHQATNEWFKPVVRIFKNARRIMVDRELLPQGVAPSYHIENLLFNVPNHLFGTSYRKTVFEILVWLNGTDRSAFRCAHGQYPMFGADANVTWNEPHCQQYLSALTNLWNTGG